MVMTIKKIQRLQVLLCFSLFLVSDFASAQMSEQFKKGFVTDAASGCYEKQRQSPENKYMPDKFILNYCSCAANELTNLLTDREAVQIATSGKQDEAIKNKILMSTVVCQSRLKKAILENQKSGL
jgi:hypothetical protein